MPKTRIRDRLRAIQVKRANAEQALAQTDSKLAVGAEHVAKYVELLDHSKALYDRASDEARRDLNMAAFTRLHVDDTGVIRDTKTPIVQELHDAAREFERLPDAERDVLHRTVDAPEESDLAVDMSYETEAPLLQVLLRGGWNRGALVPPTGFEPALPP